MNSSGRKRQDDREAAGIAVLEQAAEAASTGEQRALLEQAAADLTRLAAKRVKLRESRKRSEQRWKQRNAEREARLKASVPAAEAPFPLKIERTDEVADFSNCVIEWARVWRGTTEKGTRFALAVCSIAVENGESLDALDDPGVSGDLERWLSVSTGGGVPCEIKDDFDAEDLESL